MKSFFQSHMWVAAIALALAGCGGSDGGGSGSGASTFKAGTQAAVDVSTGAAATAAAAPASAAVTAAATPTASPQVAAAATPVTPLTPIESKISVGSEGREVDPFKPRDARSAPAPVRISLGNLPAAQATLEKSAGAPFGAPQLVGVARPVGATASAAQVHDALSWKKSESGAQVAALRFESPGAQGVRLGLLVRALPFGAFVRFYADGADSMYEFPGQEILAGIDRNLAAGDSSDAARTFWSPNLRGAAVTLEIEIPAAAKPAQVDVSIPSLSHFLVDTRQQGSIEKKLGTAASCNLDVACTSTYNELSKSVALIEFVSDGNTYTCTGTLLNDRLSSGTPYFLTAKHCITNQTIASTLTSVWFYTSSSCSSGTMSNAVRVVTDGATLLYVSPAASASGIMAGDTAFLRLDRAPPAGALFAGSSAIPPDAGTSIYGVHHPRGDVQKYSVGFLSGNSTCTSTNCTLQTGTNPNFLRVYWTQGVTENGSSGSGLFTRLNNKDYLIGQLLGGGSSCTATANPDFYGRFDVAYNAALGQWLNAINPETRVALYRFYNAGTGAHFYTASALERNNIIVNVRGYRYEGVAFNVYGVATDNMNPVYRFYNTATGSHFYTISEAERAQVQATQPSYRLEGVSWFASTNQSAGSVPIYRFYNNKSGTHFYTASEGERNQVQSAMPNMRYEGIAYDGWPN